MAKPEKPIVKNEPEEKKVEAVDDLKKSTLTDYLQSFFSSKKNESTSAPAQ